MSVEPVIVFRNEHFIVVDKPAGWLSVPSRQGPEDARPCVGRHLEKSLGLRIFPVHRLDEPVSGLLLFALQAEAHRAANGWFERGEVSKCYEAFAEPRAASVASGNSLVAPPAHGTKILPLVQGVGECVQWTSSLAKGKKRAYLSDVVGKTSVTRALLVAETPRSTRWNLWPLTGRSHQLRFELFQHGCPILGDTLYGSPTPWSQGIALRVFHLDFQKCKGASALGLPSELRIAGLLTPA
jgi:tRNA pseudouridine32 synthase / 23S rRNA pseudouridine746 synthase